MQYCPYRPIAVFMFWSCAQFCTAHVRGKKKLFCAMKLKRNSLEQTKTMVVQRSKKSIRSLKKQIDKMQRCHSLVVWLAVQIVRWKELSYHFILFHLEPLPLRKREKKTGWGKLVVKIGTIKMNGHTKGFRNKEFVEHTFCQVS